MEASLAKYRAGIQSGKVKAHVRWDGQESKTIFDPEDPSTPLDYIGFGVYKLDEGPFEGTSEDKEYVFIPIDGEFEFTVNGQRFVGARPGGPFATLPETSNSSAVYIGRGQKFGLKGAGAMCWFSAPAYAEKPAVFIRAGEKKQLPRGKGVWHREIVTLVTTDDASTNLIAGETYSPPGLWSGTPIHTHDKDDPRHGQADLEEVYYHAARLQEGSWGPYAVQLLFDAGGLEQAYIVGNGDAIAIPGGAHPVVAGPASDILYYWGLASSKRTQLKMLDVGEFTFLKGVENILDVLEKERGTYAVAAGRLAELADREALSAYEREILRHHLIERGYRIEH